MTIYIDSDHKCHVSPGTGLIPIETDTFTGKCAAYIEGYRFVPEGSTWTRSDGTVFSGEMIAPWKPLEELDEVQREYERKQCETLSAQNAELVDAMASMVEDVYNQDVSEIEGG